MKFSDVLAVVLALVFCSGYSEGISNQLAAFHKAFEDARQELLGVSNLGADDEAVLRQRRRTIDELLANFQNDLELADELEENAGRGDWSADLSALELNKGCKSKGGCGGDWKMARDISNLHKRLNLNEDLNDVAKLNLKYKGISSKLSSPMLDSISSAEKESSDDGDSGGESGSGGSDNSEKKTNKKFQSILEKIEENNNRIGTIIQNANLDQVDTSSMLNNIKNINVDSKTSLSGFTSFKNSPNLELNSFSTLKKDKKYKTPDLDVDLDEKPLQQIMEQMEVSKFANDQREQTKNDLSHEANYKLSKIEQDAAEQKKEAKWNTPGLVKRSPPFNAMNEIKLKTSFRLMDRGFGPSLPSNALTETRRSMKVEDMLKRIEQNYDLDTADASAKDDFEKLDSVLSVDENSFELLKSRYKRLYDDLTQTQPDMNRGYNFDNLVLSKKILDNADDATLRAEPVSVVENRKEDESLDNGSSNEQGVSEQELAAYQGAESKRRVKRIGPLMDGFRAESYASPRDLNEVNKENSVAAMQRSRRATVVSETPKSRRRRSVATQNLKAENKSPPNHNLLKRSAHLPSITGDKKMLAKSAAVAVPLPHNVPVAIKMPPRNAQVATTANARSDNERDKRIFDDYTSQQQQPKQQQEQQSTHSGFDFGSVAHTLGFDRFDNLKPKSTFVNTDGMHFDNLYNDISNTNTSNASTNNNNNNSNDNLENSKVVLENSNHNSNVDNEANSNNNNARNDAKLLDDSNKAVKSVTCSMPSSSEPGDSNNNNIDNNNFFSNINSPFGNFTETVSSSTNNKNSNNNNNKNSNAKESNDDSKTLMLALRDEILNCSAFTKLEHYLKSHGNNASDNSNSYSTGGGGTNANGTGAGAGGVEEKIDVVVTPNTKPSPDSSPHISTERPEEMPMKLNININASVIGDQKATNFIGNGTINVRPSYSEERERRGVIFPNFEPVSKRKCKMENLLEYNADSSAHIDNVMSGKMSAQVVRTLFNFVQDNPTLKVLWPSLKNNHLPHGRTSSHTELAVMGDSEKAKSTQILLQRAMSTINDIIEQQVRSRTCIPLRPDLSDFYELILHACTEQERNRDKRESTLALANTFSEEKRTLDPGKIEAKSRIVKKLLKQYEELPHEDQAQVAGIRDDLLRDLMYLRKLRDSQNELRERRKRELTEQRQQHLDANSARDNDAVRRLEAEYTPQFLKLLKTAEIFREAATTN